MQDLLQKPAISSKKPLHLYIHFQIKPILYMKWYLLSNRYLNEHYNFFS